MAEPYAGLVQRVSLLVRRIRLQVEELFDQAWAVLPAQPLLTFFLFIATLAVIVIDAPAIAFERVIPGWWVFWAWCFLGLVGPVLLLISRHLIVRHRQHRRLFGFWLRTAADIMQLVALTAYLAARILVSNDDSAIFSLTLISGVWLLQALWVIRDIWALVLIERTATRLNAIVYGRV